MAEVQHNDLHAGDPATDNKASINFLLDGNGSAITAGPKGYVNVPFDCTIVECSIIADQVGSLVVDIWKAAFADGPPSVDDTMVADAKPTLSSQAKSSDTTLTGWTTTLAEGDILAFNVDSAAAVTLATVFLRLERS